MPPLSAVSAVDDGLAPHVQLGEHTYVLYPQRHAYLTNRLGKAVRNLTDTNAFEAEGIEGIVGALGDRAYDLLGVFIPKLMPEYEFRGFATQEALDKYTAGDLDAYDEQYDRSPTFPEVAAAFQTALNVNRLDLLKALGKVVDPNLIRAYINKAMADFMESRTQPSFSSEGVTSDSTPSGTSPPTSTLNAG